MLNTWSTNAKGRSGQQCPVVKVNIWKLDTGKEIKKKKKQFNSTLFYDLNPNTNFFEKFHSQNLFVNLGKKAANWSPNT